MLDALPAQSSLFPGLAASSECAGLHVLRIVFKVQILIKNEHSINQICTAPKNCKNLSMYLFVDTRKVSDAAESKTVARRNMFYKHIYTKISFLP